MTSVFKIHDTVLKVSKEAKSILPTTPIITDEGELLAEIILCILSSQEKYEAALAMVRDMQTNGIIREPQGKCGLKHIKADILAAIRQPISFKHNGREFLRRLRFFKKKTDYVCNTLDNLYGKKLTIKKVLQLDKCIFATRRNIIKYVTGLGPKQASMFLRNIGYYSEFAIIDTHIIDYMKLMGIINTSLTGFSSILVYQKVEDKLKLYASTYDVNLLHLDLAIWTTMRTLKNSQDENSDFSIRRHRFNANVGISKRASL